MALRLHGRRLVLRYSSSRSFHSTQPPSPSWVSEALMAVVLRDTSNNPSHPAPVPASQRNAPLEPALLTHVDAPARRAGGSRSRRASGLVSCAKPPPSGSE